jgi:hypothetical protein
MMYGDFHRLGFKNGKTASAIQTDLAAQDPSRLTIVYVIVFFQVSLFTTFNQPLLDQLAYLRIPRLFILSCFYSWVRCLKGGRTEFASFYSILIWRTTL